MPGQCLEGQGTLVPRWTGAGAGKERGLLHFSFKHTAVQWAAVWVVAGQSHCDYLCALLYILIKNDGKHLARSPAALAVAAEAVPPLQQLLPVLWGPQAVLCRQVADSQLLPRQHTAQRSATVREGEQVGNGRRSRGEAHDVRFIDATQTEC